MKEKPFRFVGKYCRIPGLVLFETTCVPWHPKFPFHIVYEEGKYVRITSADQENIWRINKNRIIIKTDDQ